MFRSVVLAGMAAAALGCGQPVGRSAGPATVQPVAAVASSLGPRWVAVQAEGLNCPTCAAGVKEKLAEVAGISQIETFAPQPYVRFYVEDGSLDVAAMLDRLREADATLAEWKFIRGG